MGDISPEGASDDALSGNRPARGTGIGKIARTLICGAAALLFLVPGLPDAQAAPPAAIAHQGYLTSSSGAPVNATVSITFALYDVAGNMLWNETQSVVVGNGLYNVTLGQGAVPLTPTLFDAPLFLGVTVGTDPEMTPRIALTSVPYALQSSGIAACSSGATNCGGTCSSLSGDANNCGACGNACIGGHACIGGACQ
jgi:hypothetical protein